MHLVLPCGGGRMAFGQNSCLFFEDGELEQVPIGQYSQPCQYENLANAHSRALYFCTILLL